MGIPLSVYESPPFAALNPWALKLLIDVAVQYNGHNNGDLSAAWKLMEARGWHSETTLNKAKKELLAAGYLVEMRKGRRPNVCTLFALTWRPLNPSPKHDFGPNGFTMRPYEKPLQMRARVGASENTGLTPPRADSGCG
ncbi:MAG: hypothetical protein IPJ08_07520 [Burkholderiales bacterium]|nr:hypothetical protein [Burkholderiales bacterium]